MKIINIIKKIKNLLKMEEQGQDTPQLSVVRDNTPVTNEVPDNTPVTPIVTDDATEVTDNAPVTPVTTEGADNAPVVADNTPAPNETPDNTEVPDNTPSKYEGKPNVIPTKKYQAQPDIEVGVNPTLVGIINQLEDENTNYEKLIQANRRAIDVLKVSEVARNGVKVWRGVSFKDNVKNAVILVEQPPVAV